MGHLRTAARRFVRRFRLLSLARPLHIPEVRAVSLDGLMVRAARVSRLFYSIEVADKRLAIHRGPFVFSAIRHVRERQEGHLPPPPAPIRICHRPSRLASAAGLRNE